MSTFKYYQLRKQIKNKIKVLQFRTDINNCDITFLIIRGEPICNRDLFSEALFDLIMKLKLTADIIISGYNKAGSDEVENIRLLIHPDILISSEYVVTEIMPQIMKHEKTSELKHKILYEMDGANIIIKAILTENINTYDTIFVKQ